MKFKVFAVLLVAFLAVGFFSHDALAKGREAASCLLYPYFNTNPGNVAVITVTNTCDEVVHLRIVFISADNDCLPKNYYRTLTGYDTFTFVDKALNQKEMTGFLYIYVVEKYGDPAEKKADCLIGQEFVFESWDPSGGVVNWGVNAVSFAVGSNTVDGDGKLVLDGSEYDEAPSRLQFPRFFGQEQGLFESHLIVINLTGGKYYEANVYAELFDDSEHPFSDQIQIPCFFYDTLVDTFPDTKESHLDNTSTDFDELYDGNPPGPAKKKTGWFELIGLNSHYFTNVFDDIGIYGLLIEKVGPGYAADLPWEFFDGVDPETLLWSTSPNGD